MKFNSQLCTTREQSERLIALGLKKETADMFWWDNGYGSCAVISRPAEKEDGEYGKVIPAWSLHRLIELCSQQIYVGKRKYFHTLHLINNEYVAYIDDIGDAYQYHDERDLYNSLISCIEWLIKEGYFNKEYLVNQAEIDEHCKGVLEYLDYIRDEKGKQ